METLIKITNLSYAIIFGLVTMLLSKHIISITKKSDILRKFTYRYVTGIYIWYLLSLLLSIKGFFHDPKQFSEGDYIGFIYLLAAMFTPLIIFFFLFKNKVFQKLIDFISLKFITNLLTYRILGGIYWFLLLFDNRAPALFIIPPAIFDAFIGLTAPAIYSNRLISPKIAKLWNYLGIFDFLLAFSIYFLYFPFKLIKVSPELIMWGGFYPVAFIVIFVVPLSIILHIIALKKISKL
ncbi:MAG: hypothetical protein ABIH18_03805 [Candidatus Omnitrophota bacterium]